MQNQNNNNIMISRQPTNRSGTPNSMVILEQGQDDPPRPPSGRRSANRRSPLKIGGSSLELLPAEEDDNSTASSRLSDTGVTDVPRLTQSAGSVSHLSHTEGGLGNGDGKGGGAGLRRSTSIDGRAEVVTPDSPRKQVYLTTVKRNFEQHGMPKNEELAKAVQYHPPLQNGPLRKSPSSMHRANDSSHRKQRGERPGCPQEDAENEVKDPEDVRRGQGSNVQAPEEMSDTDSYYISHEVTSYSSKASAFASSDVGSDSYYLTHKSPSSTTNSEAALDKTETEESLTQADRIPGSTCPGDAKGAGEEENESSEEEEEEEEEAEEDEERKAPFQLLGEFLEAVMEEDYENAEKLCKMVLLYEPENAEAKQFQPLIEEMLKREREAQLWGSESEEEEEEDDADDADDDDEDSDSDDDDSDEDSDEDEDEEDSSSGEEQDETKEEKSDTQVEK